MAKGASLNQVLGKQLLDSVLNFFVLFLKKVSLQTRDMMSPGWNMGM